MNRITLTATPSRAKAMAHDPKSSATSRPRPVQLRCIDSTSETDTYRQDRELVATIERASNGDRLCIEKLVQQLSPCIAGAIRRRLRTAVALDRVRSVQDQVEDLSQEVFLALFRDGSKKLKRWDHQRGLSLERYVALIADRLVISFLRRIRPADHPSVLDEATLDSGELAATRTANSPYRWLESQQTLELLLAAVTERLSPLGQRVFNLLYIKELSVEQTCADTGMSTDAVYAWRSRLRRQLRALLKLIDVDHTATSERPGPQ